MFTPEEMLHQSYYTTETIQELAESIASYMENDALKDASTIHFLIAAAHASDICTTIQEKEPAFDLMPCEAIEKKADPKAIEKKADPKRIEKKADNKK